MENLGPKRRLTCNVIDELAEHRPDQLFCMHPVSSDITQGWRYVSFQVLADSVNCMAQWIEKNIGQSSQSESLAYMGANDIRYATFVFACMKTGHAVRLCECRSIPYLRPNNMYAAVASLFTELRGSIFARPQGHKVL
jgi:acyl-coenzyme A synthetase/AMP-(fatty) acid ligase